MSAVYRADHHALERKVALKLLAPDLAEDSRVRERFVRESKLAASIEHPNIVPIYDAGEVDGHVYIAMRYVEGVDLKQLLRREGPLEPRRALALVGQVAGALDAAHERGLVHRDVKPSNVLIAARDHVYLADFGLTKSTTDRSGLSASGQIVGTIDYVAPEQIEGKPVDGRADVYSLGCLLYECLTGEVPFPRDSELAVLWAHVQEQPPRASERRPELPHDIDAVLRRALAKEPERRYGTCRELVEAAQTALAPVAAEARPARRTWLLLAVAAVLVAGAAVAAGLLLTRGSSGVVPLTKLDSLARIDPATNKLAASVAVGSDPSGVAVAAGGAWVASFSDQTATRIDSKTNASETFAVAELGGFAPGYPTALAVGGGDLWIATGTSLIALVPSRPYIPHEVRLAPVAGGIANAMAGSADAVWVARNDGALWRVEPLAGGLVARIELGYRPSALALDGRSLWIATSEGVVLRVDTTTNKVERTIRLPFNPAGVAVADDDVWLTDTVRGRIVQLDPASGRLVRTVRGAHRPAGLAVGSGSLWVANRDDGTVWRIEPSTGRVIAKIRVGPHPDDVAVGAGGVWVTVHKR